MFGAWLRDKTSESGLTQDDLAVQLGLSQQAVSKWITDKSLPTSAATLEAIAVVLELPVSEVVSVVKTATDERDELRETTPREEADTAAHELKELRRKIDALERKFRQQRRSQAHVQAP